MIICNAPKFILGIALTILLLSVSWSVTASRMSTKGSTTMLPGIRLVVPIEACGRECLSQQQGCGNLSLRVCLPSCPLPAQSTAIVTGGMAPYTFSVIDPNGLQVGTSPPTELNPGYFSVTFTTTKVGLYAVTVTDAKGCRATCTDQAHLAVFVSTATSLCISAPLKATVASGTGPYTFRVTDPSGASVMTSSPNAVVGGTYVTFTAVKAGPYTVTVTDANGCQGTAVGAGIPCRSLTQSEWGKNKPKFNGLKRVKTIDRLFPAFARDRNNNRAFTVGIAAAGLRSVSFTQAAGPCIIDRLPASGAPTALSVGLGDSTVNADTCQTSPPLPLVSDMFQNELLGQTIALTLNAGGISDDGGLTSDNGNFPALWHLVLCGSMVTQGVLPGNDDLFGTSDDSIDPADPKLTVAIPTSVINAIAFGSTLESLGKFTVKIDTGSVTVAPGTVGRLLMLANLALAGDPDLSLGGASLQDINAAVDGVNRAFDGGRFLIGCSGAGKSNLQINFNPNPVDTTNACGGSFPSWVINTTLHETGGVGITIDKFITDTYDTNGSLLFSSAVSGDHFADFFHFCNPQTNAIPALGQACGLICRTLGGLSTGSVIMKFEGRDDNGQPVSFTSDRLVLRGSPTSANLAITFTPNPPPKATPGCSGSSSSWLYTATLTETTGIGINISKFTWDFYDATGNLFSTQTNNSGDFSAFFNDCGAASTRIAPNGRACGNLCISFGGAPISGSVVMTFYGTDDRGNKVIFASSRLRLPE